MSEPIIVVREGMSLKPVTADDAERFGGIPGGQHLLMKVPTAPRSWQQHKFFFALIKNVWDTLPETRQEQFGDDLQRFRYWVTCMVGKCSKVFVPGAALSAHLIKALAKKKSNLFFVPVEGGVKMLEAHSVAWANMKQHNFKRLVDKAIEFLIEEIVPGTKRADLIREVESRTGVKYSSFNK